MTLLKAKSADEWSEIATQCFVPLATHRAATAFTGTIDHRPLADVSISRVDSQSCQVARTARLARQSADEMAIFSVQVGGLSTIAHDGRVARLNGSGGALYLSSNEYTLSMPSSYSTYVVQLPAEQLGISRSRLRALQARAIPQTDGAYRILKSFVITAFDEAPKLDDAAPRELADGTVSLLRAVLNGRTANADSRPAEAALVPTVHQLIADRAGDPALSPATLAAALGISTRYLHRALAAQGEHPAQLIRDSRLLTACSLLRRTDGSRTIADIAMSSGFADISTFNRAFKRRYGMSPTDWKHSLSR